MLFILVGEDMRNMEKADIYVMPAFFHDLD